MQGQDSTTVSCYAALHTVGTRVFRVHDAWQNRQAQRLRRCYWRRNFPEPIAGPARYRLFGLSYNDANQGFLHIKFSGRIPVVC